MTVQNYIKKKPYLLWYIKDYDQLSDSAVLEAVLNYGTWEDVQVVIKILGIKKASEIFQEKAKIKRSNFRPEIKNYFNLYFKKYA